MRGTRPTLHILLLTLFSLLLATGAQAGYWLVEYNLAGSGITTTNAGGTFEDPVTGTLTFEYGATSSVAPLQVGRLVAGTIDNTLNQDAGIVVVTGANTNTLHPGLNGTEGALNGNLMTLGVVANHTVTGFLHCGDSTGPGGFCEAILGAPSSTNIPQTSLPDSHGNFTLPVLTFPTTAGVGGFIGGPITSNPTATVAIVTNYVGTEITRTWVEGTVPVAGMGGLAVLLAGLTATGLGVARRMTRQA